MTGAGERMTYLNYLNLIVKCRLVWESPTLADASRSAAMRRRFRELPGGGEWLKPKPPDFSAGLADEGEERAGSKAAG